MEKALQLTDTEQLEALKAFVEASKFSNTADIRCEQYGFVKKFTPPLVLVYEENKTIHSIRYKTKV